ncbi:MAG: apolipoprotein N-acyltransferase, partial [Kiritimatiellae bacterium]|nr:apolipoprotein N-acyltransferase [Kiritimatiellia bacterium]
MLTDRLKKIAWMVWLLPGFLLWASFPPMAEHTDCLFALAPLMWYSRRHPAGKCLVRWLGSGFFFWFATLSWMPAIVKNGGPWPLVVLGWGALAAYCSLYFGAFGWLSARYWGWAREGGYWRRLVGLVAVEPLLWAGLEIVRSRLFGGFSWNQLGVAPVNAGFGSPAALGGVYLVSACVILVNGTIASIAERMAAPFLRETSPVPNWARSVETLLPLALVWGVYSLGGAVRPVSVDDGAAPRGVRVALLQRNFPCVFKPAERESPETVYSTLVKGVAPLRPELVVLPESAMCEFGDVDSRSAAAFMDRLAEWTGARAVLAGGGRAADGRLYNSAALRSATGLQVYDKVHLVPCGEYSPGDTLVTALQRLAPVGSCTPGELKTLSVPTESAGVVECGVAICFEDTDSAQMRALAAKGARLLAFITNDSWFSDSEEAVQHSWQAVARAVETGLPVVRVGNSGVTGTIAPDGRASWLSGPGGRP